ERRREGATERRKDSRLFVSLSLSFSVSPSLPLSVFISTARLIGRSVPGPRPARRRGRLRLKVGFQPLKIFGVAQSFVVGAAQMLVNFAAGVRETFARRRVAGQNRAEGAG